MKVAICGVKRIKFKSFSSLSGKKVFFLLCLLVKLQFLCKFILCLLVKLELLNSILG